MQTSGVYLYSLACMHIIFDEPKPTAMPYYRNYDDYKLDNPYHDEPPERDYDDIIDEERIKTNDHEDTIRQDKKSD